MELKEVLDYAQWSKDIILLNSIAPNAQKRTVSRGQVYWCSLGMGVGSEERKKRPCVVISNNSNNIGSSNIIVAPITHTSSTLKTVTQIENYHNADGSLLLDGYAMLSNTVCVSKARLGDYIVTLSKDDMSKINNALIVAVGVHSLYKKQENIIADKMSYISKLKEHNSLLQNEKTELLEEINRLKKIIDTKED